jgi:CubicO group peptidase (beta-lactamase class C family)
MKYATLSLLFLLLISCTRSDQHSASGLPSDPLEYSMDHLAEFLLVTPELNAVSIGIYQDGKTRKGYYGEIDPGQGTTPTDSSLFEIASVTKAFTGMLVAQAVLDQKLTVEDDVRKYLDGEFKGMEFEGRSIRIRDLLTHSSGITRAASPVFDKMFADDATKADREAIWNYGKEDLLEDLHVFQLVKSPGLSYDYSPIVGPEIVAMALQKVYGRTYEELLKAFIFEKAGMTNTFVQLPANRVDNLMRSYTDDGLLVPPSLVPLTGAGYGLKTSVPDLLQYVKYLLESEDPAIAEMRRPLFEDEEGDEYGYFWQVDDTEFMHNGGTKGMTLWLIILPAYNAGFTVVFNSNGKTSGRLINRAANFLYDDLKHFPKRNPYFELRKAMLKNTKSGIAYYHKLKAEEPEGYTFDDPSSLNRIGYNLMQIDRVPEAIIVFELLVDEFPELANAYDSLGEGYFMNKQYALSLKNYQQSLVLDPENENAVVMMKKIAEITE